MPSCMHLLLRTSVKEILSSTSPVVQSVRFRKPRWVPISKSKEFYVRKPTPIIQEEYDELKVRYRLYRSEVESIRKFLQTDLSAQVSVSQQITQDMVDLDSMKEQVEEFNKKVAVLRSESRVQEELEQEQQLHLLMQQHEQERLSKASEAVAALQKNKAASKDFIPPDKLDEAIEKLLDSRSDYNYAITKSGEIIPGEYPDRQTNSGPDRKTRKSS